MNINKLTQMLKPPFLIRRIHSKSLMDSVCQFHRIRRVEINSPLSHERRRTSEFRQNEDAVALCLAGDVLERDEVHAVSRGGEQTCVCDGV